MTLKKKTNYLEKEQSWNTHTIPSHLQIKTNNYPLERIYNAGELSKDPAINTMYVIEISFTSVPDASMIDLIFKG